MCHFNAVQWDVIVLVAVNSQLMISFAKDYGGSLNHPLAHIIDFFFHVCLFVFSFLPPGMMGMGGMGDAPRPMAIFELLEYIVDEVGIPKYWFVHL